MKKSDSKPENETLEQELKQLRKENAGLKSPQDVHHISTDIIESDFGIYKAKQSPTNCMT